MSHHYSFYMFAVIYIKQLKLVFKLQIIYMLLYYETAKTVFRDSQ
jgi:hypothetical protein